MAFKDRLYEGIEAWNRGDVEAAVSRMHPDVVWETSGYFPEINHLYVGEGDLVIHFCAFPEWEDCAAAAADPTFGPDEAGRAQG
jgi:hypothetical protein